MIEAEQTAAKAHAAAKLAKLEYVPGVAVMGGWMHQHGLSDTVLPENFAYVGVLATYTLFDGLKREHAVKEAAAQGAGCRSRRPAHQGKSRRRGQERAFRAGTLARRLLPRSTDVVPHARIREIRVGQLGRRVASRASGSGRVPRGDRIPRSIRRVDEPLGRQVAGRDAAIDVRRQASVPSIYFFRTSLSLTTTAPYSRVSICPFALTAILTAGSISPDPNPGSERSIVTSVKSNPLVDLSWPAPGSRNASGSFASSAIRLRLCGRRTRISAASSFRRR